MVWLILCGGRGGMIWTDATDASNQLDVGRDQAVSDRQLSMKKTMEDVGGFLIFLSLFCRVMKVTCSQRCFAYWSPEEKKLLKITTREESRGWLKIAVCISHSRVSTGDDRWRRSGRLPPTAAAAAAPAAVLFIVSLAGFLHIQRHYLRLLVGFFRFDQIFDHFQSDLTDIDQNWAHLASNLDYFQLDFSWIGQKSTQFRLKSTN